MRGEDRFAATLDAYFGIVRIPQPSRHYVPDAVSDPCTGAGTLGCTGESRPRTIYPEWDLRKQGIPAREVVKFLIPICDSCYSLLCGRKSEWTKLHARNARVGYQKAMARRDGALENLHQVLLQPMEAYNHLKASMLVQVISAELVVGRVWEPPSIPRGYVISYIDASTLKEKQSAMVYFYPHGTS